MSNSEFRRVTRRNRRKNTKKITLPISLIFFSFFVVPTSVITGNYYDEMLPMNLNRAWAKAAQETVSLLSAQQVIVNDADHKMLYLRYFISSLIAYQRFSRGDIVSCKDLVRPKRTDFERILSRTNPAHSDKMSNFSGRMTSPTP